MFQENIIDPSKKINNLFKYLATDTLDKVLLHCVTYNPWIYRQVSNISRTLVGN